MAAAEWSAARVQRLAGANLVAARPACGLVARARPKFMKGKSLCGPAKVVVVGVARAL